MAWFSSVFGTLKKPKFMMKLGGAFIAYEVASLVGTYAVFHQMNTSPWFRYKIDNLAPPYGTYVVDAFYVAAERLSPEGAQRMIEQDVAFAAEVQRQQQNSPSPP
mmetsp:Transcript_39035/g.91133  ORF Transcript_39035/g.91133 Transcript_39035/m.91133 type:complete len:105 (+) Transcript_39035:148-462(+)